MFSLAPITYNTIRLVARQVFQLTLSPVVYIRCMTVIGRGGVEFRQPPFWGANFIHLLNKVSGKRSVQTEPV